MNARRKVLLLGGKEDGTVNAACRDPIICHYRMRGESYHGDGSRHAATVQQLRDPRKPKDERAAKVTAAMGRGMPRPYIPCASFIKPKDERSGGSYCCHGSRHAATVHPLRAPHKPKDERVQKRGQQLGKKACCKCQSFPGVAHLLFPIVGQKFHTFLSRFPTFPNSR